METLSKTFEENINAQHQLSPGSVINPRHLLYCLANGEISSWLNIINQGNQSPQEHRSKVIKIMQIYFPELKETDSYEPSLN